MRVKPTPSNTLPGAAWLLYVWWRETSPNPEHHELRGGYMPFETGTICRWWLERRADLTASAWRVGRRHILRLVQAADPQSLVGAQESLGERGRALRYCTPSNGGRR